MFCPRCGQEQISAELRFCSRCGFQLGGVIALLSGGGNGSETPKKTDTPRRRGIKQGAFFSLLTFVVVPIVSILTVWLRVEPFGVAITSVLFFFGGLLRIAYAFMFESNEQASGEFPSAVRQFGIHHTNAPQLQPSRSVPVDSFVPLQAASWRETNDLEPVSVIDNTTKLLQKED